MKHILLFTACLVGLSGFSGIASSPASAQTSEAPTVVTASSENAVSRNDHAIILSHQPELASLFDVAPVVSMRPKARHEGMSGQIVARHVPADSGRSPRTVMNPPGKPRAVFVPAPVAKQVKRQNPWGARRASPAVQINHGVFR